MSYLNFAPPEDEDKSITIPLWIPVTVTVEKNQDDIISFAGKNIDAYNDIKELKEQIISLTKQSKKENEL